jgi:hypothetical protein
MEYTIQRKGGTAVFALFNHGTIAIGTPDVVEVRVDLGEPMVSEVKGNWEGSIAVSLENAGLDPGQEYEVYEVMGLDQDRHSNVLVNSGEYEAVAVNGVVRTGNDLKFKLKVGRRGEFIVGPKGNALKDFFER